MSDMRIMAIASSALNAQGARLNAVASNMANVNSVVDSNNQPYRAKQVVFEAYEMEPGAVGVRVAEVRQSMEPFRIKYDPYNPAADEAGYVRMPNVNIVEEMTNMIDASRSYQANVEVLNNVKSMIAKLLTIGQ